VLLDGRSYTQDLTPRIYVLPGSGVRNLGATKRREDIIFDSLGDCGRIRVSRFLGITKKKNTFIQIM